MLVSSDCWKCELQFLSRLIGERMESETLRSMWDVLRFLSMAIGERMGMNRRYIWVMQV